MNKIKTCEVCGRTSDETRVHASRNHGLVLCAKHSNQLDTYGVIKERTNADPNEVILREEHAEIVIYGRDNIEKARAIVDIQSLPLIENLKWNMHPEGYVRTYDKKAAKHVYLHRLVTDAPDSLEVDHVNGDPLDNRTENLRLVTRYENSVNRGLNSSNTSGAKGVCFRKDDKKWRAVITVQKEKIFLGSFENFADAVAAREAAEIKYFGEFIRQEATYYV